MASTMAIPRTSSASPQARMPNLPVIEHPMSRLGDRNDLSVTGSGNYRRENTVVTFRKGKPELGLKGPLHDENPALRKSAPDKLLNWPPVVDHKPPYGYKKKPKGGTLPPLDLGNEAPSASKGDIPNKLDRYPTIGEMPKLPPLPSIEEQEEFLKGPGKPHVKSKEYNYQPRTTSELVDLLREKLGTGFYGIRHLFKANDPTGKGNVSREALQRILYTLCGYVTPDQYAKLLKKMSMENKTTIAFDAFIQYFKDTEDKKDWVSAIQTAAMYRGDVAYPESYLRRTDMRTHDPYTSMPFSDAIFKEKCNSRNFDAHRVFPGSVFEPNGLILPPQLREAYATLGIFMSDEDYNRLWQRYDREGTGALHAQHFFRQCGLDQRGFPRQAAPYTPRGAAYPKGMRPHSEISHTNGFDQSADIKKLLSKESGGSGNNSDSDKDDKNKANANKPSKKTEKNNIPATNDKVEKDNKNKTNAKDDSNTANDTNKDAVSKKIEIPKRPKVHPKLDNIIDCLHYKFEEAYSAMLTAFQLFDFLNDNYLSRVDFKRVLQEFGLNISITDLDHFLKLSGLRSVKGQINYREFLQTYQNRTDKNVTAKVKKGPNSSAQRDTPIPTANLTPDQLESRLTDHFHGEFIKLLSHFKTCDKYNLGVITPHEFRAGIERRLGYTMKDNQWDQLKSDVGVDSDGLICYTKFLELFDITPGAWNQKTEGPIQVSQVSRNEVPTPPAVDRLREISKSAMDVTPEPELAENLRTMAQINHRKNMDVIQAQLDDVFKNRFHTFDKNFKAMDKKKTGRMSKWQFGALLKMCGLSLVAKELDQVWATLNVTTDGMYDYSTLVQHFIGFKVPHVEKETHVYENLFNIDEHDEIWYQPDEDTTELTETARRIQRERREERLQRDILGSQPAAKTADPHPLHAENTQSHLYHAHVRSPRDSHYSPRDSHHTLSRSTSAFSGISRVSSIPSHAPSRASILSTQSMRTKSLLVKIRPDVINNWEGLKSVFKYIDRSGSASVATSEMSEIMNTMQFNMDTDEKAELLKKFDTKKNGRFNYLQFMKCYAQKKPPKNIIPRKLDTQNFKELGSLRRSFTKLDRAFTGHLSVCDFKKALLACNVQLTDEDMFNALTEFDANMDDHVRYEDFLRKMFKI